MGIKDKITKFVYSKCDKCSKCEYYFSMQELNPEEGIVYVAWCANHGAPTEGYIKTPCVWKCKYYKKKK